jgi:membrane-bound lytic murein transglycosylase B
MRMYRSIAIGTAILLLPYFLAAQTAAQKTPSDQKKEDLKKQLESLQGEIDSYQDVVEEKKAHAATLEGEIGQLNSSIKKEESGIESRTRTIGGLSQEIETREAEVARLKRLEEKRREDLGHALQSYAEADSSSVLEILLQGATLAEGVDRVETITQLEGGIALEVDALGALAHTIEERVNYLTEKREEEQQLRRVQELARQELERNRQREKNILRETRGEEKRYSELLTKSQVTANAIRQQIYVLEGVGVSLKFEDALKLAEYISSLTGIRPAFLLAVLKKESRWGEKQGTGNWRQDMHTRDHAAFLAITQELGLNPDTMPVSRKPWYGWGGAMGPAQFIPTTWLVYKAEVARLTGHNPPNPWNITDAFVAAGVKLSKAGANKQTPDQEWRAAMIYFAGSNWQNKSYAFYGDSVMEFAETLQEQINVIKAEQ